MDSKDFLIELAETFVVSLVILLLIYGFLAFPEIVSGASMEPLLHDKERILVEKVLKNFQDFERGEVVVFHPPEDDHIDYVKRVIGVPGDLVKISDCKVFITRDGNRFTLEEPYLYAEKCTTGGPGFPAGRSQKLSEDSYLVLGDNRDHSADSRVFGVIDKERIVGKVVFRFWPPAKIGFL